MDTRDLAPRNWFRRKYLPIKKEESHVWGGMDRDIERFFEDLSSDFGNLETFLSRVLKENASTGMKVLPKVDFSETDKAYIIEVDLPGVKEEDVDMTLSNEGMLTIKGKRETKQEQKERNYYRLERSYGSFERTLALPENCDAEKVNAVFKDGTLTLTVSKKEPTAGEMRKISLSTT